MYEGQKNASAETGENSDVLIKSRRQMEISGVKDVISFDETSAHLLTSCGEMMIEGEGLHVGTLDVAHGLLTLQGSVDSLYYARWDVKEKKGLWGKILK